MQRRVRATLVGLAVLGLGTWAQAQCSKDIDCKGDRVCDGGQCTAPAAAVAPAVSPAPSAAPAVSPATVTPAPGPMPAAQVAPLAVAPLPPPRPPMHRRSTPLMVGGIVATSVGPLLWMAGLLMSVSSYTTCLPAAGNSYDDTVHHPCRDRANGSTYGVLIAGTVLVGAGIPMIIYGAKKVPDTTVTASVAPWLAPGQAGLQLRVDL